MKKSLNCLLVLAVLFLLGCASDKKVAGKSAIHFDREGSPVSYQENIFTMYALPPLICTNVSLTACLKQYTRFATRELAKIHNQSEVYFGIPYTILRVRDDFDWEHREERVAIPPGTVSHAMSEIAARYNMDLDTNLIPGNFIFTDKALRRDAADCRDNRCSERE